MTPCRSSHTDSRETRSCSDRPGLFAISLLLLASGAGCDTIKEVRGTWTGLAVPVQLVDAEGASVTALTLTPWSGPRLTERMMNGRESVAWTTHRDPGAGQYVLIGSDHAVVSPDTDLNFRAVEVSGTISEFGYDVFDSGRHKLGWNRPPTVTTRLQAIRVRGMRPIGRALKELQRLNERSGASVKTEPHG